MYKKTIYYHIHASDYGVRVHMLLIKHVLVHIWYENDEMVLSLYVSTLYVIFVI